ncbi:hypothetical protein GGF46_002006 [Coemansia sp. RSA 552]|nr:hypothetical protein GGF46_002006 [Coemansia sp. RSA 552]
MAKLPDIARRGRWSASSSKHGFGAANLLDPNTSTFWQSDGQQPHHVSVQFSSRHQIHSLSLFLDIDKDESYTPCKLLVYSGTSQRDMQAVCAMEFAEEPRGWVNVELGQSDLMAHFLRIELPLNYDNGRDVRVRQVRVHAPPNSQDKLSGNELPFTAPEFKMYDALR